MKRDYYKEESKSGGKKKVLKLHQYDMEEGKDDEVDIREVEFRMRNDTGSVLSNSKDISYKDLVICKVILASGLYPQLAVGDEFNGAKSGTEQLFRKFSIKTISTISTFPFNFRYQSQTFQCFASQWNICQ